MFSQFICDCYDEAKTYHDGKWLFIDVITLDQLEEVMRERNIHIGIITVPEIHAQAVADRLVASGVRGIWNFAPRKIKVPAAVRVINEDLSVGLSSLSFYLARQTPVKP